MSVLDELQVVPVTERAQGYDPVRIRRKKLAAALQEQLNLLTSTSGDGYRRVRIERKRDLETDEIFEVQQRRRVVPWWSFDDAGQVRFGIRYGSVLLKLRGDDSVIVLPSLEALEGLIPSLRQEVLRGELDGPLAAAADELMARFKRQPGGSKKRA
jgi:hypothetical protein